MVCEVLDLQYQRWFGVFMDRLVAVEIPVMRGGISLRFLCVLGWLGCINGYITATFPYNYINSFDLCGSRHTLYGQAASSTSVGYDASAVTNSNYDGPGST